MALVTMAEVGVVRVDCMTRIRFANPYLLRMLGYESEEELLGRSFFDFMDAQEVKGVIEKFRGRSPGTSESYFVSLTRRDGSVFIGRVSSVALTESGAPGGTVAIVADMTKEVELFARLRESETRFMNLTRQLPAGVFEVDSGSSVHYCNDFALKLLGIESLGDRPALRDFVAEDERARFDQFLVETFNSKGPGAFPMDIVGGNRKRLPALWSVAKERRRSGDPRASIVVIEVGSIIASVMEYNESLFASFALTDRECSVARLLVDGAIYKEIAFSLGVSLSTVRTYTMSLYRKMGIHSREELVDLVLACQRGRYGKNGILSKYFVHGPFHEIAQKS